MVIVSSSFACASGWVMVLRTRNMLDASQSAWFCFPAAQCAYSCWMRRSCGICDCRRLSRCERHVRAFVASFPRESTLLIEPAYEKLGRGAQPQSFGVLGPIRVPKGFGLLLSQFCSTISSEQTAKPGPAKAGVYCSQFFA